ncbi:MAG: type IV secretion system protein [Flavobacteriaceae bacterium]
MKKEEIYKEGANWDKQIYGGLIKQNKDYKRIIFGSGLIILIMIFLLISLFPLKTIKAIGVVVDKSTGEVEIRHLEDRDLKPTEREMVAINTLTNFVIWYKTYDEADIEKRTEKIMVFSSSDVFSQYKRLFSRDDKKNPNEYYSEGDQATVKITNVIKLNKRTYQLRFNLDENLKNQRKENTRHFTSTIKFSLSSDDLTELESWKNPLGLLVTSIRFDEDYQSQK